MTNVQVIHPAPDGNGTSVLVDGVEMNRRIQAGGLSVQLRGPLPPLVTVTLVAEEFTITTDSAEVTVSPATGHLLEEAGWTPPERPLATEDAVILGGSDFGTVGA